MDLPKEKQGLAVFLSLPQDIHKWVWHLVIMDIDWVKLDKIYLHDKHTMAYTAFKVFYSYERTARVNINDFFVW